MQVPLKKGVFPTMPRILSIAIIGLGLLMPLTAGAQTPTESNTGLKPLLPLVPPAPTRELESDQNAFSKEPRGPVAELLGSATSGDAVLEIIVGQGRVLTTTAPIAREGGIALVAAGDPTVVDFEVVGPRLLRVLGRRVGDTDISITTDAGQTYTFKIQVIYDLPLLTTYLQQIYPDALIELKQLREHLVLQGQARSVEQIAQIEQTLRLYVGSIQTPSQVTSQTRGRPEITPEGAPIDEPVPEGDPGFAAPSPIDMPEDRPRTRGTFIYPQIINLMRVPGVQQVMLKVQIAELNRTAFRNIGADIFVNVGDSNLGSVIGGGSFDLDLTPGGINEFLAGTGTTAFGVFDNGDVFIFLHALRANGIVNILAEPNLVAMNGQEASFLAGGEFPVPVPQNGIGQAITVEYKNFGVQLNFVPTIMDDETIRLRVAPEVSNIDPSVSINLPGVGAIPGLSTRRANTTVELKQGQTLALAGMLQVTLEANTQRLPGLGDLPYLGPFFSNTTHERTEKELLVMVTPYLVSPMDACQAPPMPGSEITDPNDCEFYFLNRIEGRMGEDFRSTTSWDDPCDWRYRMHLEHRHFCGPIGYSE
jgi:pilus assembly protein CpaC